MQEYLTVKSEYSGEYTEKRSKFIGVIAPVSDENEAAAQLAKIRAANFGANHNVYAYVLKNGSARFSDDGEPHKTAGKPVLDVINGAGLKDVIITVTRYFGGVLLGTGGLVRAYTVAAKAAVDAADIMRMCECERFFVACEYSDHAKLLSVIAANGGTVENTDFSDRVSLKFVIKCEKTDKFLKAVSENFSSRIKCESQGSVICPTVLGENA